MRRKREIEYEIDQEEKKLILLRRIGITILVIIGILLIFLLLKSCSKVEKSKEIDLNKLLLESGKEYFEYEKENLPKNIGGCESIDLKTLAELGLIDKKKFTDCDNTKTYVKVCKLESGKYHFVAFLSCADEQTEKLYGNFIPGKEKDVISSSDVMFKFQVNYLDLTDSVLGDAEEYFESEIPYKNYKTLAVTKLYRYKDLEYIWNINKKEYYPGKTNTSDGIKEYYVSSPKSDYIYKDSEKTVAKYFSTTSEKEYYTNESGIRIPSVDAPNNEYILKDTPIYQTRYKTRTWVEKSKPSTTEPKKMYYCSSPNDMNQLVLNSPCETNITNPEYTIQEKMIYTCDGGITEVGKNGTCYVCNDGNGLKSDNSSCGYYTDWSGEWSTTECDTTKSDICDSKTITIYYWYKLKEGTRVYYPSGADSASKENTYYSSAPASNLIEDTETVTTAWKWYKKIPTKTSSYSATSPEEGATKTDISRYTSYSVWSTEKPKSYEFRTIDTINKIKLQKIENNKNEKWEVFNEEFLELDELLKLLQEKDYKVYSLNDLAASGELKYKVKLFIRNKEVK